MHNLKLSKKGSIFINYVLHEAAERDRYVYVLYKYPNILGEIRFNLSAGKAVR